MKMRFIILLISVMIVGCSGPKYNFTTSSGVVQWHKGSLADIQKQYVGGQLRGTDIFLIRGCYKMIEDVCHIYVQDGEENFAYLGHELKHCFDGRFHDNAGKWVK